MRAEFKHAVVLGIALCMRAATPALAHTGEGGGDFLSGLAHPVFSPDHVIAMVAVGLWGVFLGQPAIWLLPIVFPLVMAAGGVLGIIGVPLPAVETGIAASAIVLGAMVALAARPPLWAAAALVGARCGWRVSAVDYSAAVAAVARFATSSTARPIASAR